MSDELELGKSDVKKKLREYASLKRKLECKELMTKEACSELLRGLEILLNKEIKMWKARHAKIIINTDEIAGKRANELLELWKKGEIKSIGAAAIKKSQEVIIGKVTEHIIPHFKGFKYNPQDARFLGAPIDYVVFRGLSEGNLEEIVFIEVKTGIAGKLSKRERQVRDVILAGRIRYEKIHHKE